MARVTKQFDGVPDGQTHPITFKRGSKVEGDLARVAIEQGWATAAPAKPRAPRQAAPAKRNPRQRAAK